MNTNTQTASAATRHALARYILAAVIFCIGVAVTIGAFRATQTFEERRIDSEMERLVSDQMTNLQRGLEHTQESIQSMGGYVGALSGALNVIPKEEFKQYAEDVRKRPGIVSVAWVPQVSRIARKIHEIAVRKQGFPDFSLVDRTESGETVAAEQRERYFPLTYAEPLEELASVQGLDMGARSIWQKTMDEARDKGAPVTTVPFSFDGASSRIGVFQPIYPYGLPNKLGARRANLSGFIFVTLDLHAVVNQMLNSLIAKGVAVRIAESGANNADAAPAGELVTDISIAGGTWSIVMTPKTEIVTAMEAKVVLAGGLFLTVLIVGYLLMLVGRTAHIEALVAQRTQELSVAHKELKQSEAHLVQSEKMASIGQMVAGIVHEINTPLAYVKSSIELTKDHIGEINETVEAFEKAGTRLQSDAGVAAEDLEAAMELAGSLHEDETVEEAHMLLDNGLSGLEKISNLVVNLKNFSRLDRAEMAEHDINKGLDEAVMMVKHMLKDKVEVVRKYGEIPHVMCSPAQINQVFLNMLVNGIHAIETEKETGIIEISTRTVGNNQVEVSIKDDGQGIDKKNLTDIFEPFFTTKRSGKGTGLGLAITQKIIREHQGKIKVDSTLGKGTEFTIILPIKQS
ncbi:MAG: GHKL domain-containing protein [Gammaproteobacteria bacterium]|nr:GHKL domain-containing protein [Gammaproteobacteria bacterium]